MGRDRHCPRLRRPNDSARANDAVRSCCPAVLLRCSIVSFRCIAALLRRRFAVLSRRRFAASPHVAASPLRRTAQERPRVGGFFSFFPSSSCPLSFTRTPRSTARWSRRAARLASEGVRRRERTTVNVAVLALDERERPRDTGELTRVCVSVRVCVCLNGGARSPSVLRCILVMPT